MRIHAISIDLYSTSEKNTLIRTLTAELSDIQRPFKFLAVSRPVDISPVIQEMTELLPEAGEKQKELLKQEIVQMSGYALSGDIVERQFYLMIWEKQAEGCEADLQKTAALLCEKFSAGGVLCDILPEKGVLYGFLNLVHNPAYCSFRRTRLRSNDSIAEGGHCMKKRDMEVIRENPALLNTITPVGLEFRKKSTFHRRKCGENLRDYPLSPDGGI